MHAIAVREGWLCGLAVREGWLGKQASWHPVHQGPLKRGVMALEYGICFLARILKLFNLLTSFKRYQLGHNIESSQLVSEAQEPPTRCCYRAHCSDCVFIYMQVGPSWANMVDDSPPRSSTYKIIASPEVKEARDAVLSAETKLRAFPSPLDPSFDDAAHRAKHKVISDRTARYEEIREFLKSGLTSP